MSTIRANYNEYHESEKATLYKLECLHLGYDPLKLSDKSQIVIAGTYDALESTNDELLKFIEALEVQEKLESMQFANLSNYSGTEWHGLRKVESVIDFIDVAFKPLKCYGRREDLKGALTKISGVKYYVTKLDDGYFSIRLHDVKNKKDLHRRLQFLVDFTDTADIDDLKITHIERAIDFYFEDEPRPEFALALFKSLRLPNDADSRIYRDDNKSFKLNINTHKELIGQLADGWNIGLNDKRKDDRYYHIYIKKTDTIDGKLVDLPMDQWRVRCEMGLKGSSLVSLFNQSVTIRDLSKLISRMSEMTKFTAIKASSHGCIRFVYDQFPRLWGRERSMTFDKKRHAQPQLSKSIEPHTTMNIKVKESQRCLARKFK